MKPRRPVAKVSWEPNAVREKTKPKPKIVWDPGAVHRRPPLNGRGDISPEYRNDVRAKIIENERKLASLPIYHDQFARLNQQGKQKYYEYLLPGASFVTKVTTGFELHRQSLTIDSGTRTLVGSWSPEAFPAGTQLIYIGDEYVQRQHMDKTIGKIVAVHATVHTFLLGTNKVAPWEMNLLIPFCSARDEFEGFDPEPEDDE
jgi:hypothetical protein